MDIFEKVAPVPSKIVSLRTENEARAEAVVSSVMGSLGSLITTTSAVVEMDFFKKLGISPPRKIDLLRAQQEEKARISAAKQKTESYFNRLGGFRRRDRGNNLSEKSSTRVLPIGHVAVRGQKYMQITNPDGSINDHVDSEARLGNNVSIHPTTTMGHRPSFGDNVVVGPYVVLGDSVSIESDITVPKGTQVPDYFTVKKRQREDGSTEIILEDPNDLF